MFNFFCLPTSRCSLYHISCRFSKTSPYQKVRRDTCPTFCERTQALVVYYWYLENRRPKNEKVSKESWLRVMHSTGIVVSRARQTIQSRLRIFLSECSDMNTHALVGIVPHHPQDAHRSQGHNFSQPPQAPPPRHYGVHSHPQAPLHTHALQNDGDADLQQQLSHAVDRHYDAHGHEIHRAPTIVAPTPQTLRSLDQASQPMGFARYPGEGGIAGIPQHARSWFEPSTGTQVRNTSVRNTTNWTIRKVWTSFNLNKTLFSPFHIKITFSTAIIGS